MVHILHFSVEGIRGAIPLDETMFLVRMVMMKPSSEEAYGIVGTVNLHGILVPVYSLRKLFGFSYRSPRLTDNLIITRFGQSLVALWVDETFVVRRNEFSYEYESQSLSDQVIPGVTVLPDGMVVISDINRFLDNQRKKIQVPVSGIAKGISDSMMTDLNLSGNISDINDAEHVISILKERAEDLAKPEVTPHEIAKIEVLTFQLVYHTYAVDLKYIRESILSREITPVPGAPSHIYGVLPVRGEIIPLIDLRVLLSIPEKGLTDLNHVIVMTNGVITFGILSDQVNGITSISKDQLGPHNPMISPDKLRYILGITSDSLIVIDAE
ncbi:MAG: chemotaxis protein CheW, partial [Methanobacteriota archaeon]